jgi:hypothetical protein
MRVPKMQILTGTALSLALSAIAVGPAIATPSSELAQTPQTTRAFDPNSYVGTVRSMVGNVVTLELPNGEIREIGLYRLEQGRLGLRPGMKLRVSRVNGRQEVALAPPVEAVIVATTATRFETTQVERTERRRIELPPPVERPAPVRAVEPAPVRVEQVEPVTEVQPSRPIRALW